MGKCADCEFPLFELPDDLEIVAGITSKVNDSNRHYLLFDVDNKNHIGNMLRWLCDRKLFGYPVLSTMYMTPNGFHLVVFQDFLLKDAYELMMSCPFVDSKYVVRGYERGYWFLVTYGLKHFPRPMQYMRVKRKRKD